MIGMFHFSIDKDGLRFNPTFDTQGNESKVCIISLIGKSRLDRYRMKSGIFNSFIKADIFSVDGVGSKCNCYIEGYHHKTENVLLLHLVSRSDSVFRIESYKRWLKEDSTKDHGEYLREANHDFLRGLMFIFSVSHIILVNEPGSSFDISYIRLFKQLDMLRTKLHPIMMELLDLPDLPKAWINQARPCPPRVLFLFETCLISTDVGDDCDQLEFETISKAKSKKLNALRELQHSVEEMIFKVFKKERIVSNISTNSLLSISSHHDFVYILSEDELSNVIFDPTHYYRSLISEACEWPESNEDSCGESSNKPSRYSSIRPAINQQPLPSPTVDNDIPTLQSSKVKYEDEDLRNFLMQHINAVMKKNDRINAEIHFELISVKMFLKVVDILHGLFWSKDANQEVLKIFQNFFENHVDIDLKFSETQCTKIFVHAMSVYQKDLPDFYNKKRHLNKVNEAKQYFMLHSRGPSVPKYLKKLDKECLKMWKEGRRSCEKMSMKGYPCCIELHRSREYLNDITKLPLLDHRSNITTKSTCNCGRSQDERIDPFNHKAANFDFFQDLEKRCCMSLEHHQFSIHISPTNSINILPYLATSASNSSKENEMSKNTKIDATMDDVKADENYEYERLSLLGVSGPIIEGDDDEEDGNDSNPYKQNFRNIYDDDDYNKDYKLSQGDEDDHYSGYDHVRAGGDYLKNVNELGEGATKDHVEGDGDAISGYHGDDVEFQNCVAKQRRKDIEDDEDDVDEDTSKEDDDDQTRDDTSIGADRMSDGDSEENSFNDSETDIVNESIVGGTIHKYLMGMLNSESPRGLLPIFSSWSLIRLGKYASYEASIGIDQPGFTHQSNFLLPIDVRLQPDNVGKPSKGRVLRLYIGLEYECSKAHRFLLCSPNKMLKVTPGAHMKETGSKVVNNDMPLYFPCSCRNNASQMGQLTRIHVAVPDCDLEVKLKVKVQPGPSPCPIFFPEGGESITLRTGWWVLRMPYVYFDGSKTYMMPSDQKHSLCKLLKGCLTVLEKRTTQEDA